MIYQYKKNHFDEIKVYYNKPPKWYEKYQAYILDFKGRIDKASVKNF